MRIKLGLTILLFVVIGLPEFSLAACVADGDNWSSSGDYESVSSCVSQADPGDTITITGNATWANHIDLVRGVRLIGSGSPVITREGVALHWTPSDAARTAHDTLHIEGLIFDGNESSLGNAGMVHVNSTSADYVYLTVKSTTFRDIAQSGRGIYIVGAVYGYAALNTFDRVSVPIGAYGNDKLSWDNLTQLYGSAQNFYFEDNTIQFLSTYSDETAGYIQTGQGGRVITRYNSFDFTNADSAAYFWDQHGLQGGTITTGPPEGVADGSCTNYSTMVGEYYGNNIADNAAGNRWMEHRGGWLLMFYNKIGGNPYIGITEYCCNVCGAGGYNQRATNSYAWINQAGGNEKSFTYYDPGEYECLSDPPVENTDFFSYTASFDGTAGVGCGTVTSLPATCTTGVGYWSTDQSCSDLTGMVGASAATPIAGTLYKCTSTDTWTAYYTPYAYPHPLRGETSAQTLTLTVSGSGAGSVTSFPAGISSSSSTTYDFDQNTVVTLTATATAPNYFAGWSGDGCSGTSTCQVTMSAAKSVTATFSRYGVGTIGAGGQITFGAGGSMTLQ